VSTTTFVRPRLQVNSRVQIPTGSGEAAAGPEKTAKLSVKDNDCTEVPLGAHVVFMVKPLMTVRNGPPFVAFKEQMTTWV